jgi:hypothetical protein
MVACVFSAIGFSRPPSKTPLPHHPFEISVREVSSEKGLPVRATAGGTVESRSTLTHFGRIEPLSSHEAGRTSIPIVTVYTDSLLFRSESPFPFVAALSRDTIRVSSAESKPAAQMGGIESDEEMLRCLFEGPTLAIRIAGEFPPEPVVTHFKPDCPGGLYRRLNLPVAIRPFVFSTPEGRDGAKSEWQAISSCPSFSMLGVFPQVRWRYAMNKMASSNDEWTIEVACDTTLTGVRAQLPNGETADIVSDRIEARGTMRSWPGFSFLHEGEIEIREEIRYVRPALGQDVLEKRCTAVITLSPR